MKCNLRLTRLARRSFISAASLLLLPIVSYGESLISETWESWSVNQLATDAGDPWSTGSNGTGSFVYATDDESDFTTGARCLRLNDNASSWGPYIGGLLGVSTTDGLSIQFDYKVPSYYDNTHNPNFQLHGAGAIRLQLQLYTYSGKMTADGTTIMSISRGTWYHVEILVGRSGTNTYDLAVTPYGGTTTTVTGLSFDSNMTTSETYNMIKFASPGINTGKGALHLDNIYVDTVPADYLISETWESWSVNQLVTDAGDPWATGSNATGSFVYATGAESAFTSGSRCLQLKDNASTWGPYISGSLGTSTTDGLSVQFDYRITSYYDNTHNPTFQLHGTGGEKVRIRLYTPSGTMTADGSTITSISMGTWYRVELRFGKAGTNTYDLTVTPYGGTSTTVTGLSFDTNMSASDTYSMIKYASPGTDTGKGTILLDNIYVKTLPTDYLVTDYGADDTGVSDSSSALAAAITAAGVNPDNRVIFTAGTYLLDSAISIPNNLHIVMEGQGSVTIETGSGMPLLSGWQAPNQHRTVFSVTGSTTNVDPFPRKMVLKNLNFEYAGSDGVRTALFQAKCYMDYLKIEDCSFEGYSTVGTFGAIYLTEGIHPKSDAHTMIESLLCKNNTVVSDSFSTGQNPKSFHFLCPAYALITGNDFWGKGNGYVFRVNGGQFDTIPVSTRGAHHIEFSYNYVRSDTDSNEYCQFAKSSDINIHHNEALATGESPHNFMDLFNCMNVDFHNNVATGGGLCFFGHADLGNGDYSENLIGSTNFHAWDNTITDPTHHSVFNMGGDGTVGANRAGKDILIEGTEVIISPGFNASNVALIYSFITRNIEIRNNNVKDIGDFVRTFYDRNYNIHDNYIENVPTLVDVWGDDWMTRPTHTYYRNELVGTSGSLVGFERLPKVPGRIILDNFDPHVSTTGSWTSSTVDAGNFFDQDYLVDDNGASLMEVFYQPDFVPGWYEVYVIYSSDGDRATNVPIDVVHADGTDYLSLDETSGGGNWQLLGSYYFCPDGFQGVLLSNDGADDYVSADAMWFELLDKGEYFEAESLSYTTSGATASIITDTNSNNGSWVKLDSNGVGDSITFTLPDVSKGLYQVKVWFKELNSRGQYEATFNGVNFLDTYDQYSSTGGYSQQYLGYVDVGALGDYDFTMEVTGKNASSSDYELSIDAIEFQPLEYIKVFSDNADATGVSIVGSWTTASGTSGYWGDDYLHDGNTDQGTKSVTFTPDLPLDGQYEVFLRWTAYSNRATNAPVTITYDGGTYSTTVNQTTNGGTWVSLGTFDFVTGTSGSLTISNTDADGYVIADAVRFRME